MKKCVLTLLAILSLGICPASSLAQSDPFTVADSIQMVHFNDPDGRVFNPPVWNISADGSAAILVTTKGNVASNVVESTLWTLDLRAIAKYLEESDGSTPPSPKELFTIRGQLHANQLDSYGSLITKSRLSADAKTIYALVEQKGGRRELDQLDVTTGHEERLSQEDYSVISYETDCRGVLYSAEQFQKDVGLKGTNTLYVVDTVRGSSLNELLWPSIHPKRFLFRSDSSGVRPIAPAPDPLVGSFSISPDGSKVVALVPVEETPITWKPYLPGNPDWPIYRAGSSPLPILEYEVVDLRTNSRRPLLGSPSGSGVGYVDPAAVVWSRGGDYALVTNTFLPFDHQTQREQEARRRPCAAAYVGVSDGRATCIVFSRSSDTNESADSWGVSDLRFGRSDHDVVINLRWRGRHKTECYSLKDGVWSENSKGECAATTETLDEANRAPVRLKLEQSLDEPPTLWAESLKNARRIQIWDPNPQIAGKISGTTSVFHWLDKDNREWSGVLILPHGLKPGVRYPLVIQTHGFRPKEFLVDGAWATANAARPLAAASFVVLQIEDHHDQFMTPEEARIHTSGYIAAIDNLAENGLIDAKRVGIIGFSRTCWYVEESLLESPNRFAAAVIADGVDQSYLQYMLRRPGLPGMESERYNGGEPIGKTLEAWLKAAPDFRLSELKTPLRLQAIAPGSLLLEWEIYASLRIQNKPVDMVYFPLGQHVLQNPAERMASQQGDVDWFRFWLKGEEDPDPAKRTQYERWEKLRKEESK